MADKGSQFSKMTSPCKSSQFCARYLGSKTMNKLYSQTMQPWVMAEVRRRKTSDQNVVIDIVGETLTVQSVSSEFAEPKVQFHHHLRGLTRFAKLHQDPCCFAYLTRYQANADFECHVFLVSAEEVIPDIFKAIREASKSIPSKTPSSGQSFEEAATEQSHQAGEPDTHEHTQMDAGNSLFEVKNLGYAKVGGKRVTSEVIDHLAEKMLSLQEDHLMRLLEQKEQAKLAEDEAFVMNLFYFLFKDSGTSSLLSSAIDAVTRRRHFSHQDVPARRSSGSSGEVAFHDRQRRASGDLLQHKDGQGQRSRHPSSDSQDQDEHNMVVVSGVAEGQTSGSNSGIALLHIGQNDLSLLSLDTKTYIMESKFSNISFVSQGNHKQDVFGIVARSAGSVFICYILKCLNESVVSEVMNTLQAAFTSAYNKTGSQDSPGNSGNTLSSQAAHDILLKKIHSLPDKDISAIRKQVQLCDRRQQEHTCISEAGARVPKLELGLTEEKHTLFEGLRNKARKSLTTSFENLLSRDLSKQLICYNVMYHFRAPSDHVPLSSDTSRLFRHKRWKETSKRSA
ncbi:TBC1 domain family member 4 [Elysia marginata]|uniref:TBC1 domain family member 4 n=1 Tax=Elysia marginata TaxID=1093978 RepID=A0AAV4EDT2_9GAST|nr:TBC1 domain family member 4 [Elysia marginata]